MNGGARVNLHCHTTFSDGALPPEQLAERLAAAGVAVAALTDHDTLDGLVRFRQAMARHGVSSISGLEMTTQCGGSEAHLLVYGLDTANAELQATLTSIRQRRVAGVESITHSIRKLGSQTDAGGQSAAPDGRITTQDAISLAHRAGGLAILAHPLFLESDPDRLRALLVDLKAAGLDGIEALYAKFDESQQQILCAMADDLGLLVSAGTDFHEPGDKVMGIDMPAERWKRFREALGGTAAAAAAGGAGAGVRHESHRLKRRHFVFHIIFPALMVMVLFAVAIFAVLLPRLEAAMLDRKREMIRELTNAASSILAEAESEERAGRMTRAEAQRIAGERIRRMRYGREGKDYFWLQDMTPRIVMHPYRADLIGKDVSDFTDPRGARIFVEFAELVRRQKEGYIDYVWQWKDDPQRLVPKESYVQGFEPWGWIIGTGIYIEDVKEEITRIERNIVRAALAIAVVVALLLSYVMRESLRIERRRRDAEDHLRESTERYRSLVEATTEGTLLVLDGRCRYANPILLEMLGYSEHEIELLDPSDIIPAGGGNATAWEHMERLARGEEPAGGFEGLLRRRDGSLVDCVLALSRISFGGKDGFIVLAREVGSRASARPQGLVESARDMEREAAIQRLQTALLFLHEPVRPLSRPVVACGPDTPIHRVASLMAAKGSACVLVRADNGEAIGMVTGQNLSDRVVAARMDPDTPVCRVMSAPLIRIGESAQVCEAILLTRQRQADHLAVAEDGGRVIGVLGPGELLGASGYGTMLLTQGIGQAGSIDEVVRCCREVPSIARALLESGAHPRSITRAISSVCDAATERLVQMAIAELGTPPAEFAFISLGSQGRQEQSLFTDQDNAIIHLPQHGEGGEEVREYFLALGNRVCGALAEAGYALCRGEIMAKNPRWVQPLSVWKQYFADWIAKAEPQQILDFCIFFDLRGVCGRIELVQELREQIWTSLRGQPAFFPHFAREALQFKPPMRLFGKILGAGTGGESARLNLKDALMPIVSFARLYALKSEIGATGTLDRLDRLVAAGILSAASRDDISAAHEFLMRLRLRRQTAAILAGDNPDNQLGPHRLGPLDEAALKQCFTQIDVVQKRVSLDFLGGT